MTLLPRLYGRISFNATLKGFGLEKVFSQYFLTLFLGVASR